MLIPLANLCNVFLWHQYAEVNQPCDYQIPHYWTIGVLWISKYNSLLWGKLHWVFFNEKQLLSTYPYKRLKVLTILCWALRGGARTCLIRGPSSLIVGPGTQSPNKGDGLLKGWRSPKICAQSVENFGVSIEENLKFGVFNEDDWKICFFEESAYLMSKSKKFSGWLIAFGEHIVYHSS